jgi:hypothetical protein
VSPILWPLLQLTVKYMDNAKEETVSFRLEALYKQL